MANNTSGWKPPKTEKQELEEAIADYAAREKENTSIVFGSAECDKLREGFCVGCKTDCDEMLVPF